LVGAALLIAVVAPELPSAASRTPPFAPTAQKRLPSSVTAPRTLLPLKMSVIAVVVSTPPAPSTLATTRLTAAVVLLATAAVPASAS
jgi:hypothetical protein